MEGTMSVANQPDNMNFLSPLGFRFTMSKMPNIMYFVQSFDFPELSLNNTNDVQTPFNKIIIPGDHVTFGRFSITFKIDEDMKDYFEIYDWIIATGFPENFDQYKKIAQNPQTSGRGVIVDAYLLILSSTMRPNIKITFNDVIPVSLSGFKFDSTATDVNYVTATAEFKYRQYKYERLT